MRVFLDNFKWVIYLGILFSLILIGVFYLSTYFIPKSTSELKVVFLADRPDLVSTLGEWTYNKWKNYDPTLTLENSTKRYEAKLQRDKIPLVLLLLDKNKPIGMVSLNENEPIDEFKDKSPWIGDFYLLPQYGTNEIQLRRYLMRSLQGVAQNLDYKKIYVFTSDPSRVDWYTKLGWKIIKTTTFKNHLVTVMDFDVNSEVPPLS